MKHKFSVGDRVAFCGREDVEPHSMYIIPDTIVIDYVHDRKQAVTGLPFYKLAYDRESIFCESGLRLIGPDDYKNEEIEDVFAELRAALRELSQ